MTDSVASRSRGDLREEARALLRRCCVAGAGVGCEVTCSHGEHSKPFDLIRDPGSLPTSGVLSRGVMRDLAEITGAPLSRTNAVRVLADGVDSLGAMLELVEKAKSHLRFENFLFRADSVGRTFAQELRARAASGVMVRVLHDPAGALMARRLPADLLFRESTVQVGLFNLGVPTRRARRLGRDHRKLVVVDSASMVAGGVCLADAWAGNCLRHCTWRDSAVFVEGPAAHEAGQAFDETWKCSRRSRRDRGADWLSVSRGPPDGMRAGSVPVRIVTDLGRMRSTREVLKRVIDSAEREVLITNPYFVPPKTLKAALRRALCRGVEVSLLLPGSNNHPVVGLSVEHGLGPLLEDGCEVFLWQGTMIHAKSVVVDGVWTLIGSSNLDSLSLEKNAELNVEIHGRSVGDQMVQLFRRDCTMSTRFTLEDWRNRRPVRRAAGRVAASLWRWQ